MQNLIEVQDLSVSFRGATGPVTPVDRVSFSVSQGEILGVVGESGSGKSLTALALTGLAGAGALYEGRVRFRGEDILGLPARLMEKRRGRDIAMIFQDPQSSLNPVLSIGAQLAETFRLSDSGRRASRADIARNCIAALYEVGIAEPERVLRQHPHELSGGMCQRVMIAMMIARRPALLIADEPTTALDVTVQAQILRLMKSLRDRLHTAIILISHDLGVIAQTCDRVAVMYGGRIVENATIREIFEAPRHPYTQGLLQARASLEHRDRRLRTIAGTVPAPRRFVPGCRFAPRCERAGDICSTDAPVLTGGRHRYACHDPRPIERPKAMPPLAKADAYA